VPIASRDARRFVRQLLDGDWPPAFRDAAVLGVSELVTNACLHARSEITVVVHLRADGLRIEVADDSPARPREQQPGLMATSGRGLRLLSSFGTWGVGPPLDGRSGKTVWFEPSATA
jgi:anti-sigma regulatory factor (Ser/Thr protein kinase)